MVLKTKIPQLDFYSYIYQFHWGIEQGQEDIPFPSLLDPVLSHQTGLSTLCK